MWKRIWFYLHWIVGLIAGIVLIVVGITGAALSFDKEITEFINKPSFKVEVSSKERLDPEALLEKFKALKPDVQISMLSLSSDPSSSASIVIQDPNAVSGGGGHGRNMITYYINPYTGDLLPEVRGKTFFRVMLDLHRRLMAGQVGKQIVGASTVALILLSLSGIYLYWGSIRKNIVSSLKINFKAKGRGFLYKLHSALGLWGLIFFLLIALTGLTWSYEWYRASMYALAGVEMPKRMMPSQAQGGGNPNAMQVQRSFGGGEGESNGGMRPEGERNARGENGSREMSGDQRGQNRAEGRGQQGEPRGTTRAEQKAPMGFSFKEVGRAWNLFDKNVGHVYEVATLRLPAMGGRYEFSYLDEDAAHSRARNTLTLDLKNEKILSHVRYDDKRLNEKIMSSMLPLHSGEFFGWVGRIFVFLASVGMLLFGITGWMLYLDRRKKALKKAATRAQITVGE